MRWLEPGPGGGGAVISGSTLLINLNPRIQKCKGVFAVAYWPPCWVEKCWEQMKSLR